MKTVNRNLETVAETTTLDIGLLIPDHFPNSFTTQEWIDLLLKVKAEEEKSGIEYKYRLVYNYDVVEFERVHYRPETYLEYKRRISKEEKDVKAQEKKEQEKREKEAKVRAAEYAVYLELKEKFENQ